jgi:hypothetical protein
VKRLFWLGVGLAAGVYASRRATAAAQSLSPAGIGAERAQAGPELAEAVGEVGAEVRAGMAEREHELTALVERRTGETVPTLTEALSDDRPSPRPRAPRAGAPLGEL